MSDKTQNKAKLIEGPVGPLLFRLTVPMIWGILAIMAFNVIDTIFIAKLGTTHLAAISFTFPVVMVVTNLAIGLGIGASSVVSRAIGEDNHQEIQNLTISALILSFVLAVVFIVIGYLTTEPLFSLLGAGDDTLPLISAYMNVWYLGIGFLIIPIVGNYIVRATGDMFWPAMVMAGSSILNLILDPILI
ncbi:MAG: Na+-driven multidrug efflux pump, partial [Lysobacterales bacterium]